MRISDWSSDVCSSDLIGIGDDACARLNMHHAILHHCRSQDDAAVHRTVGREIADAARIRAALFRLKLGNDLARPHLGRARNRAGRKARSEEHTSELQSLMRISYAVFCLKKKKTTT